jgi:hypothetical protein
MLRRFNDIKSFAENEKEQILFTLDAMIHEIKNRRTYAIK